MSIDHRRANVGMPQQFLYRADVPSFFQQVRRKAVSQCVAMNRLLDSRRHERAAQQLSARTEKPKLIDLVRHKIRVLHLDRTTEMA